MVAAALLSAFTLLSGFKGCAAEEPEPGPVLKTLPGPEPEPEPTTCDCNADCAADEECIFPDVAVCPPCPPNALCEPCADPANGICQKTQPPETECSFDGECGEGEYCEILFCEEYLCECPPGADDCACPAVMPACTGECKPVDNPDPTCSYDDECAAGELCQIEICEDIGGCEDCGPDADCACLPVEPMCFGTCQPKKVEPTCAWDEDCGSGQYCEYEGCEDGWACDCAGDDEDCGCLPVEPMCYGTCKPIVEPEYECIDISGYQEGCGDEQVCEIAFCEDYGWFECDDDDEPCAMPAVEPVCYGFCKDVEPQPEYCSTYEECSDGKTCNIEVCEGVTCLCAEDGDCDCPDVEPWCWGTCQEDTPPPPGGCESDADCGTGEYCEIESSCLMWCEEGDDDCCGSAGPGVCAPKKKEPKDECVTSGCSGEICAPQPMDSICIWQEWYECLALSTCEANANGCGWTQNPEFDACMSKYLDF